MGCVSPIGAFCARAGVGKETPENPQGLFPTPKVFLFEIQQQVFVSSKPTQSDRGWGRSHFQRDSRTASPQPDRIPQTECPQSTAECPGKTAAAA